MAITLTTTKGTRTFDSIRAAAEWLEEMQPSHVSLLTPDGEWDHEDIECGGEWDANVAEALIASALAGDAA